MIYLYIGTGALLFLAFLFLLWVLALCAFRQGSAQTQNFPPFFAHRGLHDGVRPENSIAAFKAAVEKGYGFEFDLHLTSDGRLAVMHDDTIFRMCGEDRKVCESSLAELRAFPLPDGSPLPTFEEVLELTRGRVPLLIELKTDKNNALPLCEKTLEVLKGYSGRVFIESFDPRVLWALKKRAPEIPRGQLADNFLHARIGFVGLRLLLSLMVTNLLTNPDFVAYNIDHRDALPLRVLEKARLPICFWTVRQKEELRRCMRKGQCAIFENLTDGDIMPILREVTGRATDGQKTKHSEAGECADKS